MMKLGYFWVVKNVPMFCVYTLESKYSFIIVSSDEVITI